MPFHPSLISSLQTELGVGRLANAMGRIGMCIDMPYELYFSIVALTLEFDKGMTFDFK